MCRTWIAERTIIPKKKEGEKEKRREGRIKMKSIGRMTKDRCGK